MCVAATWRERPQTILGQRLMDVVAIEVWAAPGRPAAVGHLGTVVLGATNSDGEILVKFTLSRRLAKKWFRKGSQNKFDTNNPDVA